MHVHLVNVNSQKSDLALLEAFFALTRGTQSERAAMLGNIVDRSTISRWKNKLAHREDPGLDDDNRDALRDLVQRLRGADPYEAAYQKGVADTLELMRKAVERAEKLRPPSSSPGAPPAPSDVMGVDPPGKKGRRGGGTSR